MEMWIRCAGYLAIASCLVATQIGCEATPAARADTARNSNLTGAQAAVRKPIATDLAESEQADDVIYGQVVRNNEPIASLTTAIPMKTIDLTARPLKPDRREVPKRSKVSAELGQSAATKIAAGLGNDKIPAIVLLRETIKIPKFPRLAPGLGRDAAENVAVLARSEAIIGRVRDARSAQYTAFQADLEKMGATVRDTFWLISGASIEIPASMVNALAERDDVVSVDPVLSGMTGTNMISDSRAVLGTDWYFNNGLSFGYIGAIDSGVRATHTLLNNPYHLTWVRDCVNGTSNNCGSGGTLDPTDAADHGTSVISILTGNGNLGNDYRGITGIQVDSFRVTDSVGAIYGDALIRAYQAAVAGGDNVITASLLRWEDQDSTIAAAADAAFDAGSVIVACQGNEGPSTFEARCPGNARKALAVGQVDVTSLSVVSGSSRGPATDWRTKPDIMAPTYVYAADAGSDTATRFFNGCSAATPHAAATAALWRNWVSSSAPTYDPGMIAAFMIANGDGATGSVYDYTSGAGISRMPSNLTWYGGSTTIGSSGTVVDNPITFSGSVSSLDAVIWWPETSAGHNDVDLELVNPSGTVVDQSTSSSSIWEKVHYSTTTTGTWKVRIKGYNITSSQKVYWVMYQRY